MVSTVKKGRGKARTGKSRRKTGRKKARNAVRKQPIRREAMGVTLLLLALCIIVSHFNEDGWLIALLPTTMKGLFGLGYYVAAAALIGAAYILLTHKGRPVTLRVACALLSPYLAGSLHHMLFCQTDYVGSPTLFGQLWETGQTLASGGVLSGATAIGFMVMLGKTASVIIFSVLLAVLMMTAAEITPATLLALWREWQILDYSAEDYDNYDEYDDYDNYDNDSKPAPPSRRESSPAKPRRRIDIPLDNKPLGNKSTGNKSMDSKPLNDRSAVETDTSWANPKRRRLFQPKADDRLTPADVAADEPAVFSPEPAADMPVTPEPVSPYDPPVSQEPSPPPAGEKRKKRRKIDVEAASAQVAAEIADSLPADTGYEYPPLSLLHQNLQENYIEAGAELRRNAQRLADTLQSFGVAAKAGDVIRGPAVTRYEYILDQGVKLTKITNLSDDIALALGASGVRIAPIPEKISVVGIEVPNKAVSPVLIHDVLSSQAFAAHKSRVAFALGRDIGNRDIVGDIARLPHVLIAGTTGSGKSVCTNSLIVSLLYKSSPEDVRFIMVDPKMVELAPYNGIPHLLIPVVTDPKKAAGALQWAVYEMMRRYKAFSELGVKKLEEYNAIARQREDIPHMASVVVVIDELADLMLVAAKEVEESICRVAQMGRAAGMHLVIATQRPSADVITGLMKANIPSRIAFAVASSLESRIILDAAGAEKLVGRGDMLYAPLGSGKPLRVQGCFITPEEIDQVVRFVKSTGEAQYSDEVMQKIEESLQEKDKKGNGTGTANHEPSAGNTDELLPAAVEVILETGQASVSMLQRRLKVGYSRAARLVDQMEAHGYVGPFEGSKPRQLLITKEKWQEQAMRTAPAPERASVPERTPVPERASMPEHAPVPGHTPVSFLSDPWDMPENRNIPWEE